MKLAADQIKTCPNHGAYSAKVCPRCGTKTEMPFHTCHATKETSEAKLHAEIEGTRFVICGQIMGGKNNIVITRQGRRFPKASWAKWRENAVEQIADQIPFAWKPIDRPVNIRLDYFTGDKRRRDMPAIVDAIFHVLEKAGVITDDWHLWVTESSRGYDKDSPRAVITFKP